MNTYNSSMKRREINYKPDIGNKIFILTEESEAVTFVQLYSQFLLI